MYTILLGDDNQLTVSVEERIMQQSKLVDNIHFLVEPVYKEQDMSGFTCLMEYLPPVSKRYKSEILSLSDKPYKGMLEYKLPFDTNLTAEAGDVVGGKGVFVTDVTYNAGVLSVAKGDTPVTTTLTGVVHTPTYDAETRTIKMPVFGGDELTINLGKDMVVKSGAYNAETKEIELTISTGEVVKIPAAALVDVYTGGATKTASVTVSDKNVISVDVKVSAAENNNIEIKEDGLYVANPDAYTKTQTDEKIKAVNDALSGHSGDKVAHITAEERTAWNAKATTENVATAKSEAISAAATDAQKKADAALSSAKEYAAGLNTAMDTRVKAVEGQLTWQTIAAKV